MGLRHSTVSLSGCLLSCKKSCCECQAEVVLGHVNVVAGEFVCEVLCVVCERNSAQMAS
jgi:hypothetical protein